MKKIFLYTIVLVLTCGFMAACLEDQGYTDIINKENRAELTVGWYGNNGTPNNRSVALPAGVPAADYKVAVSVNSYQSRNEDFTVKLAVDASVIAETNAGITHETDRFFMLPDSTYSIPSLAVSVPKDTTEAFFTVTFYQDKIDKTKNYLLPLRILDQPGVQVASNTGTLKLTFIGNPLGGPWLWDFYRWDAQNPVGDPRISFTDEPTLFAPLDGLSVKTPTGYYTAPNYLITFSNNAGVLTDFKAVIAPDEIEDAFTSAGIKVVDGPTITVSADYKKITIHYTVFNGAAYRYLIDEYHR